MYGDADLLSDSPPRTEIQKVITAKGWTDGPDSLFFILAPNGVGSFFDGLRRGVLDDTSTARTTATSPARTASPSSIEEPYRRQSIMLGAESPNVGGTRFDDQHQSATAQRGPSPIHVRRRGRLFDFGSRCAPTSAPGLRRVARHRFRRPAVRPADQRQSVRAAAGLQQRTAASTASATSAATANTTPPAVNRATAIVTIKRSPPPRRWTQLPSRYAYQWLRCGAEEEPAAGPSRAPTSATYEAGAADSGNALEVYASRRRTPRTTAAPPPSRPASSIGVPGEREGPAHHGHTRSDGSCRRPEFGAGRPGRTSCSGSAVTPVADPASTSARATRTKYRLRKRRRPAPGCTS